MGCASMSSSASSMSAASAGACFILVRAMFVNSNGSMAGACHCSRSSTATTRGASGSRNMTAASADASTTITRLSEQPHEVPGPVGAHLPDDADRVTRLGREAACLRPLVDLLDGEGGGLVGRLLDHLEQLSLKGSPIALRAQTQLLDDLARDVLDGEADGHASIRAPWRNHSGTTAPPHPAARDRLKRAKPPPPRRRGTAGRRSTLEPAASAGHGRSAPAT